MNAVINSRNEVIAYTNAASGMIEIAGAVAQDGSPVNRTSYRVSASRRNRAKLHAGMPSTSQRKHNSFGFFVLVD